MIVNMIYIITALISSTYIKVWNDQNCWNI